MLWLAFVDSDLIEHSKIFAFPTPPPPAVHQLNFSQENRWNAIKCIIYRRSSVSLLVWCSNFSISGRNVLFRCCFRFFPTFKAKHGAEQKENFLWQEFSFFFEDFSSLISRYFYQLVACAWYAVERFFFLSFDGFPQVFLCSDGLKSVKILLFYCVLLLTFSKVSFYPALLISLCAI